MSAREISDIFEEEPAAYRFLEQHVWPEGPICPHCGDFARIGKLAGATRTGTYKCYSCRKPFTLRAGTIFEGSHISLHMWLRAIYLVAAGDRTPKTSDLQQILGVTFKTSSLIRRRIETALRSRQTRPGKPSVRPRSRAPADRQASAAGRKGGQAHRSAGDKPAE